MLDEKCEVKLYFFCNYHPSGARNLRTCVYSKNVYRMKTVDNLKIFIRRSVLPDVRTFSTFTPEIL